VDLVVLDVMLPGLDGFQIVERMRHAGNYTPVLMLTAKGLPEDVVEGLAAGADDYLPKPFDLSVLLARVRGLIRRRDWARGAPGDSVRVGPVAVDFANFELRRGDAVVPLTLLEAMLLKLLVEKRGQVVTKAEILEKVWNLHPDTETRAVDNFVMRLRRHLEEDAKNPRLLQTVRGVGYRLAAE
jgi:DNA-binding response OmpR family regulator